MPTYKAAMNQSFQFICVENKFFKFDDVLGDGNCFFHALVKSPYLNVSCHKELRAMLVKFIRDEMTKPENGMEKLYRACLPDDDFREWLHKLEEPRSWAGDVAATFVSYFFEINICIVTNAKTFWVVDQRMNLRRKGWNFISEEAPTVFLYHHLFRRPFTKSKTCNHFAYLLEVDKQVIQDNDSVYYGTDREKSSEDAPNHTTQENSKKKRKLNFFENHSSVNGSDTHGLKEKIPEEHKQGRKSCVKKQKGTILECWNIKINLSSQKILNDLVLQYEEESKRIKDEIMGIKEEVEPPINAKYISGTNLQKISAVKTMKTKELNWTQRSCIIFFYLHPFMGGKSIHFMAKVFSINYCTLEGWLSKSDMILQWIPIVKNMSGRSVRDCIPAKFIKNYQTSDNWYDSKYINFRSYEQKLRALNNDTQTKFSDIKSGLSTRLDIVKAKKEETLTIQTQAKRVRAH